MNPFRKEKIFGLPGNTDKNDHEKTPEQLGVVRPLRKEYGSDHVVNDLNNKIKEDGSISKYVPDKKTIELQELKSEYKKLSEDPRVQEFFQKSQNILDYEDRVKELEAYLQGVLTDSDSQETDYKEKALELSAIKKDIEHTSNKINATDKETMVLVNRYVVIQNLIKDIGEKIVDQNLKTEQGNFLN